MTTMNSVGICADEKCRKPFKVNSHHHLFCSKRCKNRAGYHRREKLKALGFSTARRVIKYTCTKCGKKIEPRGKTAMCRGCLSASISQETDDRVFRAVVEFKIANDGLSPRYGQLAAVLYNSTWTVAKSMKRLEKAGRIKRTNSEYGHHPRILVVGGKWVYEGEL